MDSHALLKQLHEKPEYEKFLYRYGFLITDHVKDFGDEFPFLKLWHVAQIGQLRFWVHPDQKLYVHESENTVFFLVGHCYNPFQMVSDETQVLEQMARAFQSGESEYHSMLAELTGVFVTGYITEAGITVYGDAAGMFMAYYGNVKGHIYITSHGDLVGILNSLTQSEYVQRLVKYRFYPLFGRALPGDISPYDELKRLVPNHSVNIGKEGCTVKRFYPTQVWEKAETAYSMEERVGEITRILKNSMALIPQKWSNPAISLTGGCDSKTTLACAEGEYEKYSYFSYISQEAEKVDADGAHVICQTLKIPHEIHEIPDQYAGYEDLGLVTDIISANQGHIGKLSEREVQKRIFLADLKTFDVEVKSWVSEVARAYYHKRFAKKTFPVKPTPRYLTTLYKVFVHDRKLVKETDRIFERYIEKYLQEEQLCGWSWLDLFFWEFRVGSWNGLVITGEHRYSGEITIPYNNRKLLEMMLAVPVEMRVEDKLYEMIRAQANPDVDAAGVAITNLKHTNNRAKLERIYLEVHSRM